MAVSPLLIGTTGTVFILAGFMLNLLRFIEQEALTYLLLNLVGSVLLVAYSTMLDSIPFMVLNTVWGVATLIKLVTRHPKNVST